MDKIKSIIAKAGWVVALIMAAYMAISSYIAQNPMPQKPAATQVQPK